MLKDLIVKNRSCRRFYQESSVDKDTLIDLVDMARLSASAANLQPLKYLLSNRPETNEIIYRHLAWAGYLADWPGPELGERPSAYIIILLDTAISKSCGCDHGIAAQSILLGAVEKGLGGCMIASIQKNQLKPPLNIPARFEILLVIALGKPKEVINIEDIGPEGNIEYWRDNEGVHHVPKRALKDIIIDPE